MKKVALTLLIAFCFVGCTGRVQTNPLPNQNKTVVPGNYSVVTSGEISQEAKNDFDRYASLILLNKNFDARSIEDYDEISYTNLEHNKAQNPHLYEKNSIWQTGLNIANRQKKDKK